MKRSATAVWNGGLKDGKGTLTTESGAMKQVPYAFANRFENEPGTNPEELIAAAHAGCFSMAFSGQLGGAGMTPKSIRTTAQVSLEKDGAGWTVKAVHLDVTADVPNANPLEFGKAAENAKRGCPISRLLNATITMDARLAAGAKARA